ncbi:hypothetical protein RDV64_22830 (plasmid) [Acuticoccus sp. MNP-M23]|uniref:hypothetical protein n=1 Tax=Acuticoccus sp. MNP-M23 TaxID=3072793 RepID=UPI002814A903|nr:hypothetical protein [Acuticoccus sp. MNP-M23]WMS45224.1 hypothetical protein RDV64_22830 [Acuticoccus sp. MNP-M23]
MTMKTKRLALPFAALVALTAFAGTASAAEPANFGCGYEGSEDKSELDARASNYSLRQILEEYRFRWDAAYARAQCKAFSEGKPYQISCLRGRRDWDAIAAMVPNELWGMSRQDAKPFLNKLKAEDDGYSAAMTYCRELGAIPKKWNR